MHRQFERAAMIAGLTLILGAALAGLAFAQGNKTTAAPAAPRREPAGTAADTVRQLEIAAAKDTASFDKTYRLGVAYLDRDRPLEAVEVFERCVRLRPGEVKARVNLGAALDAMGRGEEARMAYRTALGLRPDDELALCRMGASHYATGSRAAAMDTLRVALRKHPSSYCAYFTLGVAFADAQMFDEAIRAWEKVVEVAPESPEAQSAKESIATLRDLMKNP